MLHNVLDERFIHASAGDIVHKRGVISFNQGFEGFVISCQ